MAGTTKEEGSQGQGIKWDPGAVGNSDSRLRIILGISKSSGRYFGKMVIERNISKLVGQGVLKGVGMSLLVIWDI